MHQENQESFFQKIHFFLQKIYFRGSNFLQETKDKLFYQEKKILFLTFLQNGEKENNNLTIESKHTQSSVGLQSILGQT